MIDRADLIGTAQARCRDVLPPDKAHGIALGIVDAATALAALELLAKIEGPVKPRKERITRVMRPDLPPFTPPLARNAGQSRSTAANRPAP